MLVTVGIFVAAVAGFLIILGIDFPRHIFAFIPEIQVQQVPVAWTWDGDLGTLGTSWSFKVTLSISVIEYAVYSLSVFPSRNPSAHKGLTR